MDEYKSKRSTNGLVVGGIELKKMLMHQYFLKSIYKTLLIASLFCLTGNSYGQNSHTETPPIGPFAVGHYIGIPQNGKVQFYEDTYDEGKDKYSWHQQSEFPIPAGTIGIAGNERKLILLFKDSIVFYNNEDDVTKWERQRAFSFDKATSITPKNWLRNDYSTECGFSFLQGDLERGYAYEDGKWLDANVLIYKNAQPEKPLLPCDDYKYIFDYQTNGISVALITDSVVKFCMPSRFALRAVKKYIKAEEINKAVSVLESKTFTLPQGTENVFLYLWESIAVVNKKGIDFYQYSGKNKKWEKENGKTLLFK